MQVCSTLLAMTPAVTVLSHEARHHAGPEIGLTKEAWPLNVHATRVTLGLAPGASNDAFGTTHFALRDRQPAPCTLHSLCTLH